LGELAETNPFQAFRENEETLVGHLDDFVYDRRGSNRIQIARLRGVDTSFALRDYDDGLVFTERVDELNRTLPPDGQRQYGVGE
jgi:hypothetical protein